MLICCILIIAAVCGIVAAPWRAPRHLTTISHPRILILAGLTQLPVLLIGQPFSGPLLGVLIVALWIPYNVRLPGVMLLSLGVFSNALAMAANGGAMPLAPSLLQELGLEAAGGRLLLGSKDVIGQHNLWGWLGDWIVLRAPFQTFVASPGDMCVFAALGRWICACHGATRRLPKLQQHQTHMV